MKNEVFQGDCLEVLKNIPDHSIDLIYLDPPFYTQKIHKLGTEIEQMNTNFRISGNRRQNMNHSSK